MSINKLKSNPVVNFELAAFAPPGSNKQTNGYFEPLSKKPSDASIKRYKLLRGRVGGGLSMERKLVLPTINANRQPLNS